jgi:glycosyltransferase involved in cell wall biosynthesis
MACQPLHSSPVTSQIAIWSFWAESRRRKVQRPPSDWRNDQGAPLRIAAKIPRDENQYFKDRIEPMLDGTGVQFIGEVDDHTKGTFLGKAAALLFPIDWPEPFGLVMIEAMACGTPVIAMRRGSVPEIIEDGVTGFVVDNE